MGDDQHSGIRVPELIVRFARVFVKAALSGMALAQVASLVGALNRDWVFVSIAGGGKAWKMIRAARVF